MYICTSYYGKWKILDSFLWTTCMFAFKDLFHISNFCYFFFSANPVLKKRYFYFENAMEICNGKRTEILRIKNLHFITKGEQNYKVLCIGSQWTNPKAMNKLTTENCLLYNC